MLATQDRRGDGSYRILWTFVCGLGVCLGMALIAPASIAIFGVVMEATGRPEALTLIAVLPAGILGGFLLGVAQWLVLRKRLPGLRASRWILGTIGAAIVSIMLWVSPVFFLRWPVYPIPTPAVSFWVRMLGLVQPSWPVAVLVTIGRGLGAGLLFGVVQHLELRRHAPRAGRWIWANILAWTPVPGFVWIAVLLNDRGLSGSPWSLALGVACGVAGGLVVGAVTGAFLPEAEQRSDA